MWLTVILTRLAAIACAAPSRWTLAKRGLSPMPWKFPAGELWAYEGPDFQAAWSRASVRWAKTGGSHRPCTLDLAKASTRCGRDWPLLKAPYESDTGMDDLGLAFRFGVSRGRKGFGCANSFQPQAMAFH